MTQLDDVGKVWSGFWFGLVAGSLIAFFRGPRLRTGGVRDTLSEAREKARDTLESMAPVDPLKDSIRRGKEAAHQRQTMLEFGRRED